MQTTRMARRSLHQLQRVSKPAVPAETVHAALSHRRSWACAVLLMCAMIPLLTSTGCSDGIAIFPTQTTSTNLVWLRDPPWKSQGTLAILPVRVGLSKGEWPMIVTPVVYERKDFTRVANGDWNLSVEQREPPQQQTISADQISSQVEQYSEVRLLRSGYRLVDRKTLRQLIDERDLQLALSGGTTATRIGQLASVDALVAIEITEMQVSSMQQSRSFVHDDQAQVAARAGGASFLWCFLIGAQWLFQPPHCKTVESFEVRQCSFRVSVKLIEVASGEVIASSSLQAKTSDCLSRPSRVAFGKGGCTFSEPLPSVDAVIMKAIASCGI